MNHAIALLLVAVLITASSLADDTAHDRDAVRKLFVQQPRTVEKVRDAAEKLRAIASANPTNFDDQWHAARAWDWLANFDTKAKNRSELAKTAIGFARRAVALDNKRVEGHYYLATCLATLASIERNLSSLGHVKEMEKELLRATELDEKFDEAGPHRLLALYKLDALGTFTARMRIASKHAKRAIELAPDYPENQLALARVLWNQNDKPAARKTLEKVLAAPPWPGKDEEAPLWKRTAEEFKKKWSR